MKNNRGRHKQKKDMHLFRDYVLNLKVADQKDTFAVIDGIPKYILLLLNFCSLNLV